MLPAKIDCATQPIGKPKDWDEAMQGHCSTLWVREEIRNGIPFMVSAWEVSPGELAAIQRGAMIHIGVSAPCHPVLSIGTGPIPADRGGYRPPIGFAISEERDDDGKLWCQVSMALGSKSFMSAHEIKSTSEIAQVSAGLMAAIMTHAKAEGWL